MLALLLLALLLAAPSTARHGGPLRIDFPAPTYDEPSITFYCLPTPVKGGLGAAAAILLGGGPASGQRMVVADGVATVAGVKQYCASLATFGTKAGAGRAAQVIAARTLRKPPEGERGVRISLRECPFGPPAGSCTVRRPFVYRIRFAGLNAGACRTLSSSTSRLAGFVASGGGRWGDQWRVLKIRGRLTVVRAVEFAPAVIDRVCGRNTPRAQRLGREFGLGRPARPTSDLSITASVSSAFLDRNGQGRVSGTLTVTTLGPNASGPVRLLISANRADSARAAEVTFLPCAPSQNGTTCSGIRLTRGVDLAFAWALPVTGAGQLTVSFELQGDTTTDPRPANSKASVEVELRLPPP